MVGTFLLYKTTLFCETSQSYYLRLPKFAYLLIITDYLIFISIDKICLIFFNINKIECKKKIYYNNKVFISIVRNCVLIVLKILMNLHSFKFCCHINSATYDFK